MAQARAAWFGAEWLGNDGVDDGVAWRGAHAALLRIAKKRAGLDFEEGRWLLAALRAGAAILLVARSILGGPRDQGRSSYQVALTICECCGRGMQQGRGELVEVAPEVVEMASCDGQNIGMVLPDAHVGAASRSVFDAHVGTGSEMSADAEVEPPAPARATQSIPPATRRAVLRRDGARCTVTGCRHATFVDVHHVVPRADGGAHASENLITLCSAHHRAIHRGNLFVEGTPSTGLRFRHADGTVNLEQVIRHALRELAPESPHSPTARAAGRSSISV
jgi:hypothetical protein